MPEAFIAIAAFVKTPGHSPLKTRLAADRGVRFAEAFHRHACAATAAVMRAAAARDARLQPHWAVAEPAALHGPLWRGMPRLWQGDGDLGARLSHVYSTLLATHRGVILIGADAPQLRADDLIAAADALDARPFVLAPSFDGGFWLFGGRRPLPRAVWTQTPWSQPDTCARLADALASHGEQASLRMLRDVDCADDLPALRDALAKSPAPLPEQTRLAEWLRTSLS